METTTIMSIGEVATEAGVRASSIRYYEAVGVLPTPERQSGQRRYGPEAVERLKVIAVAQQAGFSLSEIRELLESSEEGDVSGRLKALAARKLPEVDELIARAQAMKTWLETAAGCNCSTLDVCALFDEKRIAPEQDPSTELTVLRAGPAGRQAFGS